MNGQNPTFAGCEIEPGWFDGNVPCMGACPVLTEAGRYAAAVAAGDDALAYRIARAANPFPSICGRVCAAPCERACRRGGIDEPVALRALKRFVCERYGVESAAGDRIWREAARPSAARPDAVAIVGAGPAGLACAHDLALLGYRPTIIEAADRPGGMMVLGIPSYRLPREVLDAEIGAILDLGVELRTGVALGRDVELSELRNEFGAVFLAAGATKARDLRIPGLELTGVMGAVEFLARANAGAQLTLGKDIVVVGGGNVALDAARMAVRVGRSGNGTNGGAHPVRALALEARHEMPAFPFEIAEAEAEGVGIVHRVGPKSIVGEGGRVAALETLRVESVFDSDGRFNPRFVDGSESLVACDTVILAIGQVPDCSWVRPEDGIALASTGAVAIERQTLATSAPGVFAGGDLAFGPRNIIDAVADGRRAAASIHRFLAGADPAPPVRPSLRGPVTVRRPRDYLADPRVDVPLVPGDRRVGAPEIELGFTEPQARREAARCLTCFRNVMFDPERCTLCGGCVDVCPPACLRIIDAATVEGALDAPREPAAALVLAEDGCIRCGLCVERCPTGALWMADWRGAQAWSGPA